MNGKKDKQERLIKGETIGKLCWHCKNKKCQERGKWFVITKCKRFE